MESKEAKLPKQTCEQWNAGEPCPGVALPLHGNVHLLQACQGWPRSAPFGRP